MLSRLRLAVELDCDARVLRRGAAPESYGSLLIDVAQHASVLRLSALALADDSSHLRQRLLAMKPTRPSFAGARGAVAAAFALTGIVIACQAPLPTPAETDVDATPIVPTVLRPELVDTSVTWTADSLRVPVSKLNRTPASAGVVVNDSARVLVAVLRPDTGGAGETAEPPQVITPRNEPLIFIDGVRATARQMNALDKSQIEAVEVVKGRAARLQYADPQAAFGVIIITTKRLQKDGAPVTRPPLQ
jgi:outer membrane receptor protein involved in Fe transport